MPKFRKKPVVIDATHFTDENVRAGLFVDSGVEILTAGPHWPGPEQPGDILNGYVDTLEGRMKVDLGDWVITGVKGEKYPCKPDIFAATYEPTE